MYLENKREEDLPILSIVSMKLKASKNTKEKGKRLITAANKSNIIKTKQNKTNKY